MKSSKLRRQQIEKYTKSTFYIKWGASIWALLTASYVSFFPKLNIIEEGQVILLGVMILLYLKMTYNIQELRKDELELEEAEENEKLREGSND